MKFLDWAINKVINLTSDQFYLRLESSLNNIVHSKCYSDVLVINLHGFVLPVRNVEELSNNWLWIKKSDEVGNMGIV